MRYLAFMFILSSLSVHATERLMDIVSQNRKWEIKSGSNAENCPSPLIIENEVNSFASQSLPAGDVSLALKVERGSRTEYARFPGTGGEPVRFTFRESVRGSRQRTYDKQNPLKHVPGFGFMSSRHQSFMSDRADSIIFENTTSARMNLDTFSSREVLNYNKRTNDINISISQSGMTDISCSYQLSAEALMGAEVVDGDRHLVGEREGSSSFSSGSNPSGAIGQ